MKKSLLIGGVALVVAASGAFPYFLARKIVREERAAERATENQLRDRAEKLFTSRSLTIVPPVLREDNAPCLSMTAPACPEGYTHAFNIETVDRQGNHDTRIACVSVLCPVLVLSR